jgi:hypothetical protein
VSDFETHPVGTADRLDYLEKKIKLLEKVDYARNEDHEPTDV